MTAEGLATGSMVAAGAFALSVGTLHLLSPEFAPGSRYVSEYALGRFGVLMQGAFLALGIAAALVAMAGALDGEAPPILRGVPVLALVVAAGCVAALAVFTTDASLGAMATREGEIHNELARVGFWLLVVGMVGLSGLRLVWTDGTTGGAWAWASMAVALAALAALVALRYAAGNGVEPGLVQRAFLALVTVWLFVAALGIRAAEGGGAG